MTNTRSGVTPALYPGSFLRPHYYPTPLLPPLTQRMTSFWTQCYPSVKENLSAGTSLTAAFGAGAGITSTYDYDLEPTLSAAYIKAVQVKV
jgi:hypothetical protein